MISRSRLLVCLPLVLAACSDPPPPITPPRAVIRADSAGYVVVPMAAQLPLCFVVEARGVTVRPLTESEDEESIDCPAGQPLGPFKLADGEEPYRVFVVFSDKKLQIQSTVTQIRGRIQENPKVKLTSNDLRAPGQVTLETLAVKPAELRPPK